MKTRKILLYFMALPLFMLGATSCNMKDLGNYDYKSADEVFPLVANTFLSPEGDTINVRQLNVKPGDTLQMFPIIENATGGPYEYEWFVTSPVSTGVPARKMAISTSSETPDLYYEVTLSPSSQSYTLYFRAWDTKLDLYKETTFTIRVNESEISSGWYILKSIDGGTDFDYFKSVVDMTDTTTTWQIWPNILQMHGNEPAIGDPVQLCWIGSQYVNVVKNPDGSQTVTRNQRAWYVMTTETIDTYNPANFAKARGFDDQFFAITTPKPQMFQLWGNVTGAYPVMVNNGMPYNIYAVMNHQYTYSPAMVNTEPGVYVVDLVDGVVLGNGQTGGESGSMGFDKLTNSFIVAAPMTTTVKLRQDKIYTGGTVDIDGSGNPIPDENGNYTRLKMLDGKPVPVDTADVGAGYQRDTLPPDNLEMLFRFEKITAIRMLKGRDYYVGGLRYVNGYAIMQSNLDESKHYLISLATQGGQQYPITGSFEIPEGAKILDPGRILAAHTTTNALYYIGDNPSQLCSFVPSGTDLSTMERVAWQFPGDETITWMQHRDNNTVLVLTSVGTGYKFYVLKNNGANPEFLPEGPDNEIFTLQGEGTGGYAMSR